MNLQINYVDTDIKMMPLQIRDELHIKKGYYFGAPGWHNR